MFWYSCFMREKKLGNIWALCDYFLIFFFVYLAWKSPSWIRNLLTGTTAKRWQGRNLASWFEMVLNQGIKNMGATFESSQMIFEKEPAEFLSNKSCNGARHRSMWGGKGENKMKQVILHFNCVKTEHVWVDISTTEKGLGRPPSYFAVFTAISSGSRTVPATW